MKRLLDEGLERLTDMLLKMAEKSSDVVKMAIDSFVNGIDLSDEIFNISQHLRMLEDRIADFAIELIVRYQPLAGDIRYIRSCMEIAYGFSRYGRYAYDISLVLRMFGDLRDCEKEIVKRTGEKVKEMIETSIRAFKDRDIELARKLRSMDDEVDRTYVDYVKEALSRPNTYKKCDMAVLLILRYLERIADHATYIGDSVEYILTGERTPRR